MGIEREYRIEIRRINSLQKWVKFIAVCLSTYSKNFPYGKSCKSTGQATLLRFEIRFEIRFLKW